MRTLFLMALFFFQQQQPAIVQPGGTISGRLLYSDRTPVAHTAVTLLLLPSAAEPNMTRVVDGVETDDAGIFRFEDVAPGAYYLAERRSNFYYPGVPRGNTAQIVTVSAKSIVSGLEFVLPQKGVRVSGRVIAGQDINLSNYPPNARRVEMFGGSPLHVESGVIAPDGSFELLRVFPGSYSLNVPVLQPMEGIRITVADIDVTGLELKRPPLVRILGTVAFEGRAGRAAIHVKFIGPEADEWVDWAETRSLPDGTFRVELLEGEYRAVVSDLPAGYYLKSLTTGSVDLLKQPFKADLANPTVRIVATLAPSSGVKISGRVKGSAETLPEYASRTISLSAAASRNTVSASVRTDGSFEVEKLMPGTYAARVSLNPHLSSAPVAVVIPDKDTKDLEVTVPSLVEVLGRVAVDGNGPAPKFDLMLLRGAALELKPANENELPAVERSALEGWADSGAGQAILLEIAPLVDGSFRMMLPEGAYRVVTGPALPHPFFFRSISYGSARLATESMVVSAADPTQLYVGFGLKTPNPFVKLSGRVAGLNTSLGAYRVALEGYELAKQETPVSADGTFEFQAVLIGHDYNASLVPANEAATTVTVSVVKDDVKDVRIIVPSEREVTIRTAVERGGTAPGFLLTLETLPCRLNCGDSTVNVLIKPERDGSARVKLPDDERKVFVQGLPFGYEVQSITYGGKDIEKDPLKLGASETRDLEVKLSIDPKVPLGGLRGRVTGLDAESRADQLVLHGVAFVASFEVAVNADGSFVFSRLPQGTYTPTLTGDVPAGRLTPSSVVITDKDLAGIEIAVPRRSTARSEKPPGGDLPTGVTVRELGKISGEAASESAAVAALRTINTAQVTYLSVSQGNYGLMQDLVDAGLLDDSFLKVKAGYAFSILANGSDYAAVAVPATGGGSYGYYSNPDAVVRYPLGGPLAPPGEAGIAVR